MTIMIKIMTDDDDNDNNIFEYEHEIPKRKVDEVVERRAELREKEKLDKNATEACRSLVFYDERYYWGKVLNVFADDVGSDVYRVEFSSLTYTYKTDGIWDFPKKKD